MKHRLSRSALVCALVALLGCAGAALPIAGSNAAATSPTHERDFYPRAFSFVKRDTGWVLGDAVCSGQQPCVVLRATSDGGATWRDETLPSGLEAEVRAHSPGDSEAELNLQVYFASRRVGWIYSTIAPIVWSSRNGGATWRAVTSLRLGAQGAVLAIDSVASRAYLVAYDGTDRAKIMSSTLAGPHWTLDAGPTLWLPAGGSEPAASIVTHGSAGWILVGNDRGVSSSARLTSNGQWSRWNSPCANVGASFTNLLVLSKTRLDFTCQMGGFASPLSKSAPPGAKLQSSWLYVSSNAGASFHYGPQLPLGDTVIGASSTGELLASRPRLLELSTDAGRTWSAVYRGGWVFEVDFTSERDALALVERINENETRLIATSDGGAHWSALTT